MRTFHFTTVVSISYLYKFLAMQESLDRHCKDYHLFAICVDREAYRALKRMSLKNITLFKATDFEDEVLATAKNNRNYHEYCWTLKPFILHRVMKMYQDARYFAHIDADLFFYSDPTPIVNEDPNANLFLTDHNNSERFLSSYPTSGIFNTGFVCCKNNYIALSAVEWWLDKCLERCSLIANVEQGIYGDQKYVERWPKLYSNVHVVKSKGANVAQWNIEGFHVHEKEREVYVNDDKLIFYHFSGFSILNSKEFNLSTFYRMNESAVNLIYMPYISSIAKQIEAVSEKFPGYDGSFVDRRYVNLIHHVQI